MLCGGRTAGALLEHGLTGYMATVSNLTAPPDQWRIGGLPLTALMNVERRRGKNVPVIRKALVELHAAPYKELLRHREKWARGEHYRNPGTETLCVVVLPACWGYAGW
jgi:pyrophosphate--fructose-6-phosphate 1-phosphotransferase